MPVVKTELVKIREYRDDCTVDYGKRVLSISFRISFLGDFWVRFLVNLVPVNTESTGRLHIVRTLIPNPDYLVFPTTRNGDSERMEERMEERN